MARRTQTWTPDPADPTTFFEEEWDDTNPSYHVCLRAVIGGVVQKLSDTTAVWQAAKVASRAASAQAAADQAAAEAAIDGDAELAAMDPRTRAAIRAAVAKAIAPRQGGQGG